MAHLKKLIFSQKIALLPFISLLIELLDNTIKINAHLLPVTSGTIKYLTVPHTDFQEQVCYIIAKLFCGVTNSLKMQNSYDLSMNQSKPLPSCLCFKKLSCICKSH